MIFKMAGLKVIVENGVKSWCYGESKKRRNFMTIKP